MYSLLTSTSACEYSTTFVRVCLQEKHEEEKRVQHSGEKQARPSKNKNRWKRLQKSVEQALTGLNTLESFLDSEESALKAQELPPPAPNPVPVCNNQLKCILHSPDHGFVATS